MLHLACRKVDKQLTKELLEDGADVDAQIHDNTSGLWSGCTPLHVLIFVGSDGKRGDNRDETLRLLLSHGADVTATNAMRRTALHIAYRKVYSGISANPRVNHVSWMLKAHKNFSLNPSSAEGVSYFHIACHLLDAEVVEKFFKHHDVDANLAIDAFYDWNIAASTPLHLATRTIHYGQTDYVKSWNESFAQLKIVDMLIKRGARVNVEDIDGNTPAHYDSFGGSSDGNLLERIVKSGADVNARNIRGQTPLELLLKKKDLTLEEIRYFISCGCVLNSFNSLTDVGYIALADAALSHEDMQLLIFGAFVNSPNAVKRDYMGRTAVHNIVSFNYLQSYAIHYAELFDILMDVGCDIDERDSLGRTALHLAALFRNEEAVAGLLLHGADVNVTDSSDKTPFAYFFEPCSRCDSADKDHNQYSHFELLKLFATQMRRLQLCNLNLHESNQRLLNETLEKFSSANFSCHVFLLEIEKMSELKVEPLSLALADFSSDTNAVIDYSLMSQEKREAIDEFFRTNKNRFREEFKEAVGVIQFQYRQAVLRWKIINEAKDCLSVLIRLRLPDTCSRIVLKMLKNSDLQNLILSTLKLELTNMDVD